MVNKKIKFERREMIAIARPRSLGAIGEYQTQRTFTEFFYRKTKSGRKKIDYIRMGLRYFSIN